MKKSLVGPLITVILLIVILAGFLYFYLQLNRMDKKMGELQVTISQDSVLVGNIVNFLNSNSSNQQQ